MKFNSLEGLTLEGTHGQENEKDRVMPGEKKSEVTHKPVDRRQVFQKTFSREDLQYMFQGMPYEQFADLVFDAMMHDPEMAKKITEKTNQSFRTDAVINNAKKLQELRKYFNGCSNEELAELAIDEILTNPKSAEEITKRVNQSFADKQRNRE